MENVTDEEVKNVLMQYAKTIAKESKKEFEEKTIEIKISLLLKTIEEEIKKLFE